MDHRAVQDLDLKMDMVLTHYDELGNMQEKVDRSHPLPPSVTATVLHNHATKAHLAYAHARAGAVGARHTGGNHGCPRRPRQHSGQGRDR